MEDWRRKNGGCLSGGFRAKAKKSEEMAARWGIGAPGKAPKAQNPVSEPGVGSARYGREVGNGEGVW